MRKKLIGSRSKNPKNLYNKQPNQQEVIHVIESIQSNKLELAKELSSKLVQQYPKLGIGWKLLGYSLSRLGDVNNALLAMSECIRITPKDPEAHINIGNIFKQLNRISDAKKSYEMAINLQPNNPIALNNIAVILNIMRNFKEAASSLREAIRLKSDYADAYNNLGIALNELGELGDAVSAYSEAIRIQPNNSSAFNNLGEAFAKLGSLAEAEICFKEAIRLNPLYAQAYSNYGVLLWNLERLSESQDSLLKAINITPNSAEAQNNLGVTLVASGKAREGVARFNKAIDLNPSYAEAYSNLGNALKDLGLQLDAVKAHREAIRLNPDLIKAHSNLLFCLNYMNLPSTSNMLSDAKYYGTIVSERAHPKFTSWQLNRDSTRLRVGFVSGDFRNHPVGFFIEGLLKNLNKSRLSLIGFPTTSKTDDLTSQIKSNFSEWISLIGKGDLDSAMIIKGANIDILIDLAGHTANNRLPIFAYKPAPIQASWLGYFATTGLPEMDYFIGDPWVSPKTIQTYFTEKIINLPQTWLCMSAPNYDVEVQSLPALKNGFITFGSFGNLAKMSDEVVKQWATILKEVPFSKLFLKSKQFFEDESIREIRNRFANFGISQDRLILEGSSTRREYFESYNRIDIVLDTYPYPGGTTSTESLWMGVPVLTLKGHSFLSSIGESIAQNTGRPDWIAKDVDDYVSKAIKFSSDLFYLSKTRDNLRAYVLRSPLFDTQEFSKNFEAMLWEMFNKHSY
jgi:protein O-GlcNAc transferase